MKSLLVLNEHPALKRRLRAVVDWVPMPDGERIVALRIGPLKGCKMPLKLNTSDRHLWLNSYEPWVQETLCEVLRPGMVVWDVGAYIGFYVALTCKMTGGAVLAVEPDPDNLRRLKQTIALNNLPGVTIVEAAVGDKEGKVGFEGNGMIGAIAPDGSVQVPITTLDGLVERHGAPDFVLMDIEGGEVDAIRGGAHLLGRLHPRLLIELHGELGRIAAEELQSLGYDLTTQSGSPIDTQIRTTDRVHAYGIFRGVEPA